jgi:hypothetical protein
MRDRRDIPPKKAALVRDPRRRRHHIVRTDGRDYPGGVLYDVEFETRGRFAQVLDATTEGRRRRPEVHVDLGQAASAGEMS